MTEVDPEKSRARTAFLIQEYDAIRAEIRTVHTVSQVVVGGGFYFAASRFMEPLTAKNWLVPTMVVLGAGAIYALLYKFVDPMAEACEAIEKQFLGGSELAELGWESRLRAASEAPDCSISSKGSIMALYLGTVVCIFLVSCLLRSA